MRLHDRYLFRELLVPLGFCLGGFLIFWIAFDLFGRLDDFQELRFGIREIGLYYLFDLPKLLNTALPVALLLAMLYALSAHSRHNELIALRSAGLSLWRICAPYFAVGLFLSLVLLGLNEEWLPDAPERKAGLMQRRESKKTDSEGRWKLRVHFQNPITRRDWSLGAVHLDTGELRQPRVAMPLHKGAYREVLAGYACWTNGSWRLTNGIERLHRISDDPLPAEWVKPIFTRDEMGGTPAELLRWEGSRLESTNGLVAITNLSRIATTPPGEWTVRLYAVTNGVLEGFRFSAPLGEGARRLIIAERGVWTNGMWRFYQAREFLYRSATDGNVLDLLHPELDLPELDEDPEMISSEVEVGELLSQGGAMQSPDLPVQDILDYLQLHPDLAGRDRNLLETQLHARIAGPWTCLVVAVIAIPFGAPSGRRNVFYGVAGSLALGFLYFAVQRLGFAVGQSGWLEPWVGAWLPNVLFGGLGLWLTSRVR